MDPSERYLQRAEWHDYTSRCSYLITLRSNPNIGLLSHIVAKRTRIDYTARWIPSEAGKIAMNCVRSINQIFPWVEVVRYAIMPDHVHIMLYVTEKTDVHLGVTINRFEIDCTKGYDLLMTIGLNDKPESFFLPGYNDKIVHKSGQFDNFKRYVEDNPLRYALRKEHPEYFDRCQNISIDGETFTIYGNFLLLRHPLLSCVRVSSTFSEKEMAYKRQEWDETIRSQGVLVSPFYSRDEKEIRDKGIAGGAKIIMVKPNGLPDRFKPSGREFELCCQGRLLIIAPDQHQTRKLVLKRDMCVHGNEVAEKIAKGGIDMRLLRGGK